MGGGGGGVNYNLNKDLLGGSQKPAVSPTHAVLPYRLVLVPLPPCHFEAILGDGLPLEP